MTILLRTQEGGGTSRMRFRLFPCLLALAAASFHLHAEENRYISLDGLPVPAPKSYYNADWESEVVAPGEKPCLELLPTTKKPARGTVIIAPGGGYQNLSTSKEGSNLAEPLNADGWDAAVLIYTVGKKEDETRVKAQALDEAEKALALVQKRGAEFGLSSVQVGAMGFSAGGHLVLRLAHETARSAPPDFLVVMYPGYVEKDGKLLPDIEPPKLPVFLYVGDQDKLMMGSALLNQYCQDHGIRCDFGVAPGVGHGFGLTKNLPEGSKDWTTKLRAFLASLSAINSEH